MLAPNSLAKPLSHYDFLYEIPRLFYMTGKKILLPAATLLVRKGVGPDSGTRFSSVRTRPAWIGGRRPLHLMREVVKRATTCDMFEVAPIPLAGTRKTFLAQAQVPQLRRAKKDAASSKASLQTAAEQSQRRAVESQKVNPLSASVKEPAGREAHGACAVCLVQSSAARRLRQEVEETRKEKKVAAENTAWRASGPASRMLLRAATS